MLPPIPEGFTLLPPGGTVEDGDLWCWEAPEVPPHPGWVWMRSSCAGQPMPSNNRYCRKLVDAIPEQS